MRIDNWPMDKIMQLPDCCFGRRYCVSCTLVGVNDTTQWDISEIGLPEKFVIWDVNIFYSTSNDNDSMFRLAYGDQLPTTVAEMDRLKPVIHGLGVEGHEPRHVYIGYQRDTGNLNLRLPVASTGRRLVLEAHTVAEKVMAITVAIIVSSMPKEVPDWLISGQGKNLF